MGSRDESLAVKQGTIKVPPDFGDFFVRLDGASMEPEYPDQSVAIFEQIEGQQFTFDKDYLIWFSNGECYFSRVCWKATRTGTYLELRKLNLDKDHFPDRRVYRREIQPWHQSSGYSNKR